MLTANLPEAEERSRDDRAEGAARLVRPRNRTTQASRQRKE